MDDVARDLVARGVLRLPVSMMWVASVLISMTSPTLMPSGILVRGGFFMSGLRLS
jgi:hypothetical protein